VQVAWLIEVVRVLLHRLYWTDPVLKRSPDAPGLLEDLQVRGSCVTSIGCQQQQADTCLC
jgi:hypothetical protein